MWQAFRGFLQSFEDVIYRLLVADSKRAFGVALVVILIAVTVAEALLISCGAAAQRVNCTDAIFMLDNTWKLVCGQRPHSDFYDFLGPVSLLPVVAGMAVGGCNCNAFAYGAALFLPLIAFLSWWIASRRFPAFSTACTVALLTGLPIGTFPPGCYRRDIAYCDYYNRFQWSLACMLVLVCSVAPRRKSGSLNSILEGLLAGVLGGMLLLGKLNYSVAAVLVLAAGAAVHRRSIASWAATLVGLAGCLTFAWIYLHGDLAAWSRDLAMLSGVQEPGRRIHVIRHIIDETLPELGIVALIAALHLRRVFSAEPSSGVAKDYLKAVVFSLFLAALGILITSANMQSYDIPFWALAAMILAERTRCLAVPGGDLKLLAGSITESYRLRVCLSCLAAAFMMAMIALPDYHSVAYAYLWKRVRGSAMPPDARIVAPPFQDMLLPPDSLDPSEITAARATMPTTEQLRSDSGGTYLLGLRINDGLALLRDHVDRDSRILAFDEINPFPFALQLPPPRGTPSLWHFGRLENDKRHPPAEIVFQDVTHVMVPRVSADADSFELIHRLFDEYVKEHFVEVAESREWTLLVRKPEHPVK